MIKKSVFEDELITGMTQELIKNASSHTTDNLDKAVDYLNSAIDIFEDFGMNIQASKVLKIIEKIAAGENTKVMQMPSMNALIEAGMHVEDIKDISRNPIAKARVNNAFRALGYTDKQIVSFIGHKYLMSEKEANELTDDSRSFKKMWEWMTDPIKVDPNSNLKPGDEFSMKSLLSAMKNKHKLKYADKISDPKIKGLTSEKMISNLKHHGTVFNLADDMNHSDDLLNADIEKNNLEVFDNEVEDFEDEIN